MQLDLCLSSLVNLKMDYVVNVVYVCDDDYKQAYETVKKDHPDVKFWAQSNSIFKDVLMLTTTSNDDYLMFLTDDCLIYRESPELKEGFFTDSMCCYSLRLGLNTDKRAIHDVDGSEIMISDPLYNSKGQRVFPYEYGILYDRTQHFFGGYWNYPISVDGHIFRTGDVFDWIDELNFLQKLKKWKQTPNELESALQRFSNLVDLFVGIPLQSCVVNSPNNIVQNSHNNPHALTYDISEQRLLYEFNRGKRLKVSNLNIDEIRCAHTELNLLKGLA
jgi:hypothetical protein